MKKIVSIILILQLLLSLPACESKNVSETINTSTTDSFTNEKVSNSISEKNVDNYIENIISEVVPEDNNSIDFHISPYNKGFFDEGRAWIQFKTPKGSTKNESIIDYSESDSWAALIDKQGHILWKKKGTLTTAEPFRDEVSYCLLEEGDTQSYIFLDSEGNETFTIDKEDNYIVLSHGDGLFLVAKHILDFETNEWQIGAIDLYGNTVIPFQIYEKLPPPGPSVVEAPAGEIPDPNYDYWGYLDYMEQLEKHEEYINYNYISEPLSFDMENPNDPNNYSTCQYMGDGIFELSWGLDCKVLLNINAQKIIHTTEYYDERYNEDELWFIYDVQTTDRNTYFKDGTATVLHRYNSLDELGHYKKKNVVCTLTTDGIITPMFENRWTEDVLSAQRDSISFSDGLMYLGSSPIEALFPSGAYYNLEGECILDFPKYKGSRWYTCDIFENGHAVMMVEGADGIVYVTAIDKTGELLFEPKPGYSLAAGIDGKYIITMKSGCIEILDMNGNTLYTIECICLQPGEVPVTISEGILKIEDIFVNVENGTIIGKHWENNVTHGFNLDGSMKITSYHNNQNNNTLDSITSPNSSSVKASNQDAESSSYETSLENPSKDTTSDNNTAVVIESLSLDFNGVSLTDWIGIYPGDLYDFLDWPDYGTPVDGSLYEGGIYLGYDPGVVFIVNDKDRINYITGDPSAITAGGSTLDKTRDQLIEILGTPENEESVYDDMNETTFYLMQYIIGETIANIEMEDVDSIANRFTISPMTY